MSGLKSPSGPSTTIYSNQKSNSCFAELKEKRQGKGNKDEVKETKKILLHIEYEF